MHDALSLLSRTRTARFAGIRSRLPFVSTSDEDGPDEAATGNKPAAAGGHDATSTDSEVPSTESVGRLAAVRERLPFVPGPDEETPIDAEPSSPGRFTGVRERLPLVSPDEPAADVAEPAEAGPVWRDAMVAPIRESSLMTPNRVLAVGGLLVGVGAVLSAYALLERRAEQAVPAEETWGVAESETDATDQRERGGVVGLAFLLGWSALVRRLQREEGETTG